MKCSDKKSGSPNVVMQTPLLYALARHDDYGLYEEKEYFSLYTSSGYTSTDTQRAKRIGEACANVRNMQIKTLLQEESGIVREFGLWDELSKAGDLSLFRFFQIINAMGEKGMSSSSLNVATCMTYDRNNYQIE
eukprot:Awhi_evm2s4979